MRDLTTRRDRTPGSVGSAQRGFSFLEILIVMGIIAVLAGLTFAIVQIWNKRGPEFQTKTVVQRVAASIGAWRTRFDRYPPSDPTRIQASAGGARGIKQVPNSFNVGNESLFQALYWDTFGTDPQLGDDVTGNTDEDALDKPATSQGAPLREIVDAWGNPLVYFVHTDYAKANESPPSYLLKDGTEVTPRPWKYEDESRGYAEPNGFQLFSMGPDGEPNTEDDIKSW